jgi:hypothetical protein
MPKAQITTKSGTKITIEGTTDEVTLIVERIQGSVPASKTPRQSKSAAPKSAARKKVTPMNLVLMLIEDGFFKKPKELLAVKEALQERGHYFPVTTLSPSLLRIVRKRQLRRIKEDKRWLYTG